LSPRTFKAPSEGDIVLKAQKRETQKVPHKLATNNRSTRPVRILNLSPKAQECVIPDPPGDLPRKGTGLLKNRFGNFKREIIGGRLVVSTYKHFPRDGNKVPKLPGFGFTTKKPLFPRHRIIKATVQRTKEMLGRRGDRHRSTLTVKFDIHESR
jgi:hypothetical protein